MSIVGEKFSPLFVTVIKFPPVKASYHSILTSLSWSPAIEFDLADKFTVPVSQVRSSIMLPSIISGISNVVNVVIVNGTSLSLPNSTIYPTTLELLFP